jgi:PAS domain S-box-containing protein
LNKLLQKQIKKVFGSIDDLSDQHKTFLNLVSESYDNNDKERKMLEQVLEFTSAEMIKMNEKLKRESEEALKQADLRLKHATNAANVGVWEFDFIKNEVIWNEITYRLYGLTSDTEMDGISAWKKHVHPEDQVMANKAMLEAMEGKKEFDIEYRVTWPDSSVRFLRTKGMAQHDSSGKAIKMIGTKWDITEKKIAQENIRREKELADSVINSLPGIFFIFTAEGKILRWNKNLLDVTGYSSDEVSIMNPLDFFDEDEREKMIKEIESVIINGQSSSEANLLIKSKEKLPFYFNSIMINYEGYECIMGTAINIAQRKEVEQNLRNKNKDLEEFAHIVSHSLRAPIAKIQGLASLINVEEGESKDNMNLLEYVKDEVINLDKIIKEMNSIIREKEYINFVPAQPVQKTSSHKILNVYLIDDDPVVNVISKKTIEKAGFAKRIGIYKRASAALNELRKIYESDIKEFPEVIFLDINMPEMNGWEFLNEFEKLCEEIKKSCKVFMLTSSIDPNDVKKSQTYESVKDFIIKPLTKEKLLDLKSKI